MVKFILAEEVLPLRSLVLRNGKPLNQCIFDSDHLVDSFHLGFFIDEQLISVVSFLPSQYFENEGKGFQLRGMATDPQFAGKGYGTALIGFGIDCLKQMDADYLWCNARSTAAKFYKKIGFTTESPEFDIPGIGFHYEMKMDLKNNFKN